MESEGSVTLAITLDRTSPMPLYHQIFQQFETAISKGLLKSGDPIESEIFLAKRLEVSRPTMRRALGELAHKGLVTRSRGRGTVIAAARGAAEVTRSRVLRFERHLLDPVAAADLGLAEDAELIYVEQLVVAAGRGNTLRREWLPQSTPDFADDDLLGVPVRRLMHQAGRAVATDRRTFKYRAPDDTEMAALNLSAKDQVYAIGVIGFDREGVPIQRSTVTHLRDEYPYARLRPAD